MVRMLVSVWMIVGVIASAWAQQLPIFSQYTENIGLINPSSISNDYMSGDLNMNVGLNHRSQWRNVPNFPMTTTIRGEYLRDGGGTFNLLSGLYLNHDRNGRISTTGLYGRIGAIGKLGYYGDSGFSAGILLGLVQYRVASATDIAQDPSDPYLFLAAQGQLYPDVGLGISFYHRFSQGRLAGDYFRIGVSTPQIFGLNVALRNEDRAFDLLRNPHYYGTAQYTRSLKDDSFLEISTWVKYVENIPLHIDALIRYQISDLLWLGLGGSSTKIGHVEIGLILGDNINMYDKRIRVSYSYDASFTTFFPILGSAHEINFTYSLTRD